MEIAIAIILNIVFFSIFIAILYRMFVRPVFLEKKRIKILEKLTHDTAVHEEKRRKEILRIYVDKGYSLLSQEAGIIQLKKNKPSFSMSAFIFLLILGIIPGIIYLVWHSKHNQDTLTIVLDE